MLHADVLRQRVDALGRHRDISGKTPGEIDAEQAQRPASIDVAGDACRTAVAGNNGIDGHPVAVR